VSDYTEDQAKADADALIARLEVDPNLAARFAADPHELLVEIGIPHDTVAELEQVLAGAEVEGFNAWVPGDLTHQTHAFAGVWNVQTVIGGGSTLCRGGRDPGGCSYTVNC